MQPRVAALATATTTPPVEHVQNDDEVDEVDDEVNDGDNGGNDDDASLDCFWQLDMGYGIFGFFFASPSFCMGHWL
jgi:hypothetical protein